MIAERIRVIVETSTGLRFVASILTSNTLRQTLPSLFNKYLAVVRENLQGGDYETSKLAASSITQITRFGCLIPLDEYVSDVLTPNDELFLNLSQHVVAVADKKEKLQKKKEEKEVKEKEAAKGEVNAVNQKKEKKDKKDKKIVEEKSEAKTEVKHVEEIKEVKEVKDKKEKKEKKETQEIKKESKSGVEKVKMGESQTNDIAAKLLEKLRATGDKPAVKIALSPKATPKGGVDKTKPKLVIQEQSSDSDSD